MATYNIGYIIISATGMMMGNLLFGLIKDSIVIQKVKAERKEIAKKKLDKEEILKHRKSTVFGNINMATLDTDRDLVHKE